jgi:hypothetical protein
MRKRIQILTVLGVVLLLGNPFRAASQNSYADSIKLIKKELLTYESRLKAIDEGVVTYTDCDLYSSNYRDCVAQMNAFFEENKSLILLQNKALSDIWSRIQDLKEDIDEKMAVFERERELEKQKRELYQELSVISLRYDQWDASFQQLGQMKKKAAHDTLLSLKKRDSEMYMEYSSKKMQNKDIIAQDPSLESMCNHIETLHKTISEAKDIETIKWGDLIFKVTIMAALLFFLINLIVSKKKLKNQLNGKKNKHIPSI